MPCGFSPEIMTSMRKLLNKKPDNAKIKEELAEIFKEYHADGRLIRHGVLRMRWILSDEL